MPNLAVVRSPLAGAPEATAPEWLVEHMPPGYRNRYEEIQRLSNEIRGMDRVGRLLWESGAPLQEAAFEAFAALKTEPEWNEDGSCLTVRLDPGRRLLVHVALADGPLEKKSDPVAAAFRLIQETAAAGDRVVLVTTAQRGVPLRERDGETMTPDAHELMRRMGVNVLPAAGLFSVWMQSLTEPGDARAQLDELHRQDGGTFKAKPAR